MDADLPSDWTFRPLGDIAELNMGQSPPSSTVSEEGPGIPFIQGNAEFGFRNPRPTKYCTAPRKVAKAGDILVSVRAPVGDLNLADQELCIGRGLAALTIHDGTDSAFIWHALASGVKQLVQKAQGSTFTAINKADLNGLDLLMPSLPEQRKIAAILSSVDHAIEKTQTLIDQVQVVKKGLMQELLTRGIPGRHTRFKNTEIGRIPEEWDPVPYEAVTTRITYGFTNPMPATESGPWMVTAANVRDGYIDYHSARHTSPTAFREYLTDKSRPRVGDILLTKDGALGRVAVVEVSELCVNQSVAVLQPKQGIMDSKFLAWSLRAPQMRRRLIEGAGGSTIKHIYITKVAKTLCPCPRLEEQESIVEVLEVTERYERVVIDYHAALSNVKRSLLSALLTGTLRAVVGDAAT